MDRADVIIAGAGPAGTLAAFELSRRGIPVLILEKSHFPRYKVCGAGLTHKILCELPFDLSPILETEVHTFTFSRGFRDVFTRTNPDPLIYCTMRDKLDAFLLEKAVEAGARIVFGSHIMEVIQDQHGVDVVTKTGRFRARLVIGADGASGNVARTAGLKKDIMPGLAWEAEVKASAAFIETFSQTVFLDWGAFPGGYGWLFPKKDHLSIGVGGPASLSGMMMPYYERFLKYLKGQFVVSQTGGITLPDSNGQGTGKLPKFSDSFGGGTGNLHIPGDSSATTARNLQSPLEFNVPDTIRFETLSLKAWPIPVKVKKGRFHNGRVLVTGDAAGLTDPMTGEGIYYAVRSGILAAGACAAFLERAPGDLRSYSEAVNDELMGELLEAKRIRNIFNTVPEKIHGFVRDSDRGWRAFGKVLRGERWYADVRNGFGTWRFLWRVSCAIASVISVIKEKKFRKDGFPD